MLNFKKVAITGGIASGKTTVCKLLEKQGAYIINADEIVHELLSPQTKLGKKVIALLGNAILFDGQFNRKAMAQKVFKDEKLLQKLEELLHPEVQKVIELRYQEFSKREQSSPLFIVEIPLLFESSMNDFFDTCIAVISDDALSEQRFIQKTGYDADEYKRRKKRMLAIEEKTKKCDIVIKNNASFEELEKRCKEIYNYLTTSTKI